MRTELRLLLRLLARRHLRRRHPGQYSSRRKDRAVLKNLLSEVVSGK